MKILVIAPYVPSLIRVRTYQFIRELSKAQDEVTVIAAALGSFDDAQAAQIRPFVRRIEIIPIRAPDILRSCAIGFVHGDPMQAAVCNTFELRRCVSSVLRQDQFDVVHIEHLRAARLVDRLPSSMPRLYDAVDSISLLLERTLRASHSKRQRVIALLELQRTRRFEARILTQFDRTIVTSSDDASKLAGLSGSEQIFVVPNGVDQDYFHPLAITREPLTLVFSGKMSYHANVTAILHFIRDIWPIIRSKQPDVRLDIVGSQPPAEVRELSRDPTIRVTGEVADMRPYIGKATVAICPMVVKVGIQNKLLEAMAMATPTVSSQSGAVGLLAEHGRELLVARDAQNFARLVLDLLEDPQHARAVGLAGLAYVQRHHSWLAATTKLQELYAETIRARRP